MEGVMQTKSYEEKLAQKKALVEQAEKGLEALAQQLIATQTTDALKNWLQVAARFHRYSLRNQLLITHQRPDATRCAGFHAWRRLGRSVRKGEHGIAILAPAGVGKRIAEVETSDGKTEEQVVSTWQRFRVVYVFDVAQTDGEPLPEHPATNLEDARPEDLASVENAIRQLCPVVVDPRNPFEPNLLGWTDGKSIHVIAEQSAGSRLTTLLHEAAHFLLHFPTDGGSAGCSRSLKNMRELEAEATACATAMALGYEFSRFSAGYLAVYGATPEKLRESLPRIQQATSKLLDLNLPADTSEVQAA
jgi:antirestriction protein ArdC